MLQAIWFFLSLLNYVPYVLSCSTCSHALCTLVPNVPHALRALVPYATLCLTYLVPYMLSCPTYLRPHVLSSHTCSRVIRALVSHVPRALRAPVFHVPCASRASNPMWPRASHFMSPFSFSTLLSCTLHTLCPNITFCALKFPCIALLFFCSFANFCFWAWIY